MTESVATLPSTSSYSNIITAEIRVENLSASPVEQSATISVPSSSSQQSSDGVNTIDDEPEKKRQKMDSHPMKVKKLEKLENRLGGILCCAVCLDLPRAAMYQVSETQFPRFCEPLPLPRNIEPEKISFVLTTWLRVKFEARTVYLTFGAWNVHATVERISCADKQRV